MIKDRYDKAIWKPIFNSVWRFVYEVLVKYMPREEIANCKNMVNQVDRLLTRSVSEAVDRSVISSIESLNEVY